MAASSKQLVGLAARRAISQATLRAMDEVLSRNPDDARLRTRRAEIAHDLHGVAPPGDLEQLRARLAEVEGAMEQVRSAATSDAARLIELVREHEQITADILEIERWQNTTS